MSTDRFGIDDGFVDALGNAHKTSPKTRRAIREAMGEADRSQAVAGDAPRVCAGARVRWNRPGRLILEDGGELPITASLPRDLPEGYHQFVPHDGERPQPIIVCPPACLLPPEPLAWGWAVQLYAARSNQSWGMGDLADLRRLAEWSAGLGAKALLINPLHAVAPVLPQESSPYYPASRRFRNPLYLRIEDVPGANDAGVELEKLTAAGRALNAERRIDRNAVFRLKIEALEKIWRRSSRDPAFDRYCAEQGAALGEFSCYCVLAERHGGDWRRWPDEYRTPHSLAARQVAVEPDGRARFHQWLQWLLDEQLARAARSIALVQDLPIGVNPAGADAWAWQDVLARGMSVGAPPDMYNTQGQNWGLPPFVPHKLRALGYQPFIETIRASLRHSRGLRIDHVMGLFRLFWIPDGFSPTEGAYVRYRADDLLGITALESHRHGAFVAGEDLGTVEPAMREDLARHQMLSYRLVWFEDERPSTWPTMALSAVTTHDLPTIAGLWTGSDLAAQQRLDLKPNVAALAEIRSRLQSMTGLGPQAAADEVVVRTHALLAEAPSVLVTATLEDALAVEERPNMPGTIDTWPNWSLALPTPLEEIEILALPRQVAAALASRETGVPRQTR